MNIVLQPVGSLEAKEHYKMTISKPINIDQYKGHLSELVFQKLQQFYPDNICRVWGVTSGKRSINTTKYNKLKRGDIVLFINERGVFSKAKIEVLDRNKELSRVLWGVDKEGNTWENMYYLSEFNNYDIHYYDLNNLLNRLSSARVQGFTVIDVKDCVNLYLKVKNI